LLTDSAPVIAPFAPFLKNFFEKNFALAAAKTCAGSRKIVSSGFILGPKELSGLIRRRFIFLSSRSVTSFLRAGFTGLIPETLVDGKRF
jgi:hypothetical protein